jgi:hypothetical protein
VIPDVPIVINGLARSLMMEILGEVRTPYAAQTVQLMSGLLMMVAQEFDRAAARLVEENAALLDLFRDGGEIVGDGSLREQLREACAAPAPALQVGALRERNRSLRALLVRLHEHVETLGGKRAKELEGRIWDELRASTRRRHLDLAIV